MRVLVTGDRLWSDEPTMRRRLSTLPKDTLIVHGAARGADLMAARLARELGLPEPFAYPANWEAYGKAAGPIRNKAMLEGSRPDLVLAFHSDIYTRSKGTKDMVMRAIKAGVPVELWERPDQVSPILIVQDGIVSL